MTDHPSSGDLSEVLRLASLLADQVLDAQIMSRPIPDSHIRALLDATVLLNDYDLPLPPLLGQIMHEVGAVGSSQAPDEAGGEPPSRFSRVMRAIRRPKT